MREQLIRVSDIPQDGTVTADLLGREVLVMVLNGKPRAFVNVCMHHGGPLTLDDDTFKCEWHGSTFDARTGRALSGPVRPDARRGRRADLRVRRVTRREVHHGTDREHTEPGRVLASQNVADAVDPTEVVFTPIGSVALRGIPERRATRRELTRSASDVGLEDEARPFGDAEEARGTLVARGPSPRSTGPGCRSSEDPGRPSVQGRSVG
jgi:nitrite reductase/ring-hydroxylating ferredoxin subunit